jgi:hypothetical protein
MFIYLFGVCIWYFDGTNYEPQLGLGIQRDNYSLTPGQRITSLRGLETNTIPR